MSHWSPNVEARALFFVLCGLGLVLGSRPTLRSTGSYFFRCIGVAIQR